MDIRKIAAGRLNPAAYNPRKDLKPADAEYKKLKRSLTEFGIVEPVVWNERTGNIVGGHQRFKVMLDLGQTEIDCVVVDMDETREKALNVALNKIQGDWDEAKLSELFMGFDLAGFDMELTGFDADEIESMFKPKGCVEDDFDEEKAAKDVEANGGAVTQPGDIWLLGEHRLMCGDSTSEADFVKLMDGQKAKLCVTSPPYGIGKEYEEKGLEPWFDTMRPAIKNISRNADVVCYNIGDMFNTGGQFIEPTFAYSIQMFADNGFRPLWVRIWDKKRQALSTSAPYHLATAKPIGDAEYIAAFAGAEVSENEETDVSEHSVITAFANSNYKFVTRLSKQERRDWAYSSLWRLTSVSGSGKPKDRLDERNHTARFPVELPWRCIRMHSDKNDIVLEPFSGTFTTGIACEQTERRCFAMEKTPRYCDIAVKRFVDFVPDAEVCLLRNGETIPLMETGLIKC
jgi:DNA modification methylase